MNNELKWSNNIARYDDNNGWIITVPEDKRKIEDFGFKPLNSEYKNYAILGNLVKLCISGFLDKMPEKSKVIELCSLESIKPKEVILLEKEYFTLVWLKELEIIVNGNDNQIIICDTMRDCKYSFDMNKINADVIVGFCYVNFNLSKKNLYEIRVYTQMSFGNHPIKKQPLMAKINKLFQDNLTFAELDEITRYWCDFIVKVEQDKLTPSYRDCIPAVKHWLNAYRSRIEQTEHEW